MQVWLKPRSLGASMLALMFWCMTPVLAQDWSNDAPWWTYEDDSPVIPADVLLKRFNLNRAYNNAGDYHNEHFVRAYSQREPPNDAFETRWPSLRGRWLAFNDYLARFQRSVLVNAASVSATRTYVDIDHMQLMGTTRGVLAALVNTARELTSLLEDDIVTEKWETFIDRLTKVEDALQDF